MYISQLEKVFAVFEFEFCVPAQLKKLPDVAADNAEVPLSV
jgi:hypothetical protein